MQPVSDRKSGPGSVLTHTILPTLGLLWVILPDLIPGPVDDLLVLLAIPFLNPQLGSAIFGALGKFAVVAFAALWIIFPDLVPGPMDDFLMFMLIMYMLPKGSKK